MIPGMASELEEEQMTMVQPAAVAMRAAVSLVTMPPVPHCDSVPDVSTCKGNGLPSTSCSCRLVLHFRENAIALQTENHDVGSHCYNIGLRPCGA